MFKIKSSKITEILGWYGMVAVLVAYALVSFGMILPQGLIFQMLNLTGSMGLLVVAAAKKVPQNVILNLVWIAVGIFTILGMVISLKIGIN